MTMEDMDRRLLLVVSRLLRTRLRDGWSTKWDDEDLADLNEALAPYEEIEIARRNAQQQVRDE